MPLNITQERRLVWPCTEQSRRLVEEAMGAAFNYGELPNIRDRDSGIALKLMTQWREAQLKLVRHIAHLEQLADIPGVWINEKNAALSEAEAREQRAEKDKAKAKAGPVGSSNGNRSSGAGGGGRGGRKSGVAKRAGRSARKRGTG